MAESMDVLKEVAAQVSGCTGCQLHFSRKRAVPGEGPANAEIMLIGEGPGFYENEQGRPFVGAAGTFLNELLQKAGVGRAEVFITNVVKCRPPGNRDPQPEELLACAAYLDRQIEAIQPLIIVTLGRYSMAKFLPNVKISEVHGKPAWVRGRLVIPMFHPAAALHQPSLKTSVERDFARLPEWIAQARQAGRQPVKAEEPAAPKPLAAAPVEAPLAAPQQPSAQMAAATTLFNLDELTPPEPEQPKKPESTEKPTQLSLF